MSVEQQDAGPAAIGPPAEHLQAMEAQSTLEASLTALYPPPLGLLPPAHQSPVLVLPGFTAGDAATVFLRMLLRWHGFWVSPARLGLNLGPTKNTVAGLRRRLEEMAEQHEQPVALVGISLGGVFARALAREMPDRVSQVITLGSPYRKRAIDQSTVEQLWNRVKHMHDGDIRPFDETEESRRALQVPAVSIYSRTDGIVPWQLCVDVSGPAAPNPRAENIEVLGTHSGMAHNSSVIYAVTDRLVHSCADRGPFKAPMALRSWYPVPVQAPPER